MNRGAIHGQDFPTEKVSTLWLFFHKNADPFGWTEIEPSKNADPFGWTEIEPSMKFVCK